MVSAEPSRNTRWARSFVLVVMRSLAAMSTPTRRMRSCCAGGVPAAVEVTPTCCAKAFQTRQQLARIGKEKRASTFIEPSDAVKGVVLVLQRRADESYPSMSVVVVVAWATCTGSGRRAEIFAG